MEWPPSHLVSTPVLHVAFPMLCRSLAALLACWVEQGRPGRFGSLWESQLTSVHTPRVMTVPATAIYFTTYDQLKAFLCGRALTSDLYVPMVAGALARCEYSPEPLIFL